METQPLAPTTAPVSSSTSSGAAVPQSLDDLVAALGTRDTDILAALAQDTPGARAVAAARTRYVDILSDANLRNRAMTATYEAIEALGAGTPLPEALAQLGQAPEVGPLLAATVHTAEDIKSLYVVAWALVLEFIRDVDLGEGPNPSPTPSEPDVVEPTPSPTGPKLPTSMVPTTVKGFVAYAESDPEPSEIPAMLAFIQQTPLEATLLEVSKAIHDLMPERPNLEDQIAFGKKVEELAGLARKDLEKHSPAAAITAMGQRSPQGAGLARAIIGDRNIFDKGEEVAQSIHLFWAVARLGNLAIAELAKDAEA